MLCPIGVEGIAGKQPEVLAVAAVAQLLQAASGACFDASAGMGIDI
jgi:xanthine/CO dehydrogenase XdhC/CoxF family maturation factor